MSGKRSGDQEKEEEEWEEASPARKLGQEQSTSQNIIIMSL